VENITKKPNLSSVIVKLKHEKIENKNEIKLICPSRVIPIVPRDSVSSRWSQNSLVHILRIPVNSKLKQHTGGLVRDDSVESFVTVSVLRFRWKTLSKHHNKALYPIRIDKQNAHLFSEKSLLIKIWH